MSQSLLNFIESFSFLFVKGGDYVCGSLSGGHFSWSSHPNGNRLYAEASSKAGKQMYKALYNTFEFPTLLFWH